MRNISLLLLTVLLLSACGMKGPLYLPPQVPAAQPPPASAPAAGVQSDAKKNQAAGQPGQ